MIYHPRISYFSLFAFLFGVSVDLTSVQEPFQPAAYTIPTVDISMQSHRQVVVDREKGQYLGHPTTVLLEDGRTILCVYPKGHGRGAIVYKRSTDGGLTWSDRLPTPKNWETSKEVPTIHRVIDSNGKRRLILWSGLYPARLAVSEDDGKNWSELKPAGDWGGIVVMGCLTRLKNGNYLAMFHDDGRFFARDGKRREPRAMRVYQTISYDGGLTWESPTQILESTPHLLCEPGIIRSPDGNQLAVLFRENSRTRNSFVIFSDDEATTWSEPRELPAALTGDRHTAAYAPDGRLLITFRDTTRESPTVGDWVAWVGTYDDIVKGSEGQYRVRIMDNTKSRDCAYPGLELLPDGTFVTTTYGHWTKGEDPYIVSVRFRLEELDRLAEQQATVFRRQGRYGYRIPSLVVARDGTLLAFCERRIGLHDHAQNDIVLRRSKDAGRTWGPRLVLAEEGEDSLNDPCTIVLDSGRILLRYKRYPKGVHQRKSGHTVMAEPGYGGPKNTRVYLVYSDDNGASWSDPREVTREMRRETSISVGSPGSAIQLTRGPFKGRILFPNYEGVRISESQREFQNSVSFSDDGGESWTLSAVMNDAPIAPARGNEAQIVELADGSVLMSTRIIGGTLSGRKFAQSRDGGATWSEPRIEDRLETPPCMSSIVRYSWPHGSSPGVLLHSLPNTKDRRANGTLFVSRNEGKSWEKAATIEEAGFGYSCLARLASGDIGCLHETGSGDSFRIVFKRIPASILKKE